MLGENALRNPGTKPTSVSVGLWEGKRGHGAGPGLACAPQPHGATLLGGESRCFVLAACRNS